MPACPHPGTPQVLPPPTGNPPTCRHPPPGRARRSRQALLLLAVSSLFACLLATLATRASHPARRLLNAAAFGTPPERQEARRSLLAQARETAPLLVRVVRLSKTRWRTDILPWLESIPQVSDLRTRQLRLERTAIDLLQAMGPETTPDLLPLLAERRFGGRDTALALIHSRGDAVCPILIETLRHRDPVLRAGAAMALGKFPSTTPGALPALLDTRRDPAPAVRSATLWTFGQYLDAPAGTVGALIEGLRDPDRTVRQQALQSLRSFPDALAPAVPALRELLRRDALALRCDAAHLLAVAGPAGREAEPDLLQFLQGSSDLGRRQAALALLQLDLQTDRALDTLRRLLSRTDLPFLTRTLEGLGPLGPKAAPLVPRLLELLENDNPRDDRPTLGALRQIQPDAIPERFRRNRPPSRP